MGTGITASISPSFSYSIPQSASDDATMRDILAGSKWGTAIGTAATLTYSFSTPASNYAYDYYAPTPDLELTTFSAAQQQSAMAAMQTASRYARITFTPTTDSAVAAGDVRWAASADTEYFAGAGSSAFAYYPGQDARGGDIWIDTQLAYFDNVAAGSFGYEDMLHELGHALGLSHPGSQGAQNDQLKYTVMSYRNYAGDPSHYLAQYYPTTYMLDDVAALQMLYGANMSTNAGNTTYSWDPAKPVYETIWDGGGFDTIDASNQKSGVKIDLHAGAFSEIGPAFWNGQVDAAGYADATKVVRDGLAIAYGCTIEAATGSAFDDILIGNDAANVLSGGAGNDTLVGGGGIDTAMFAGSLPSYRISHAGGEFLVAKTGDTDTVHDDVERLAFSDVSLALDTQGYVGQIFRLYQAALHRAPDAAGQGWYMKQMEQGASLLSLAQGFLASPEFQAAYGNTSDAKYVTRLYENALGREPSAAEVAYHVNALHSITRAALLVNFSESPENQARSILDAHGAAAEIYRLYDAAFDRAPDTAGLVFQVNAMASGNPLVTLAQQFIASPEFQLKYGNVDDTRFATLLYENVLGREPEAAGLAYHLRELATGTSRAQLMINFSESPEHCDQAQFVGVIRDWVEFLPG